MVTKQQASAMAPEGWAYTGYDAPYYLYQHEERKGVLNLPVYMEIRLLEEDMTARNIAFMAAHRLTR